MLCVVFSPCPLWLIVFKSNPMNPKTIFISAFFLFASALCLRAQVTYEYGTITYYIGTIGGDYLGVSTGDNYVGSKVKSKFDSKILLTDLTLLVEKANELAKEGWEVYSTTSISMSASTGCIIYNLRRKKP